MGQASGLAIAGIGNEKIQWERTRRVNVGVDANLLDNRLGVRFNYFRSATDHLLMWQEMSFLSGLDKTWGNGGKLENRGFDVEAREWYGLHRHGNGRSVPVWGITRTRSPLCQTANSIWIRKYSGPRYVRR